MASSLSLDSTGLLDDNIISDYRSKLAQVMRELSTMTYTHIVEKVNEELNQRATLYLTSLRPPKRVNDFEYIIELDPKADWIEKGIPKNFDMLPGLLNSPKAKTGKKGKYIIVPFNHLQSKQTDQQKHLSNTIKEHLKLHPPTRQRQKYNMIAAPFNGKPMSSHEGRSFLESTMVYKKGADIKTFRTASESQRGKKWIHPGLKPFNGLEAGEKWALENLPALLKQVGLNT